MKVLFRVLGPDVVHTHQIGTLIYAGPAARGAGVPLVIHTEHGRDNYSGRLRRRWMGRVAGRYAARFYCLTRDMADYVVANRIVPRDKARVILNGIDTAEFSGPYDAAAVRRSVGIPDDVPVVGTVGRLVEVKRQDVLLRAFAALKSGVPEAHLLLVGDGPLKGDLHSLAVRLGLGSCVHFAGYQPSSAPFLHAMDVFALTSESEGMPQSLLEAAVVGLPVIASRVGGIPEVIEHRRTGLLFESGDETALAEGLTEFLVETDRTRVVAEACRLRVESMFHIRRMAWDYQCDILEMLSRKGPVSH
jgi:glycosyltransferase involved in cell wall biosynthesis